MALYSRIPGSDHPIDPTKKVDKEVQPNDAVDPILPPSATNEKVPEVFETSRTVVDPSLFAVDTSATTVDVNEPQMTMLLLHPLLLTEPMLRKRDLIIP